MNDTLIEQIQADAAALDIKITAQVSRFAQNVTELRAKRN